MAIPKIAGLLYDSGGAVFNVLHSSIGAKGDMRTLTDGAITTGQAVLGSASAGFLSTDAGKLVTVAAAGTPFAGTGTVAATAGATTFSSLGATNYTNGYVIIVGGVSYTVSAFNPLTGAATLSGAPTFGASAFTIVPPLFAKILTVASLTSATLDTNAGRTVSGATFSFATDDSAAFKAGEIIAAGKTLFFPPCRYMVSDDVPINVSGSTLLGPGAVITTWGNTTSVFTIGDNGSGTFVKTDDTTIRGFSFVGRADGTTASQVAAAIAVVGPPGIASDAYVEGAGCSRIKVEQCKERGFCFGFVATGADIIDLVDFDIGGNFQIFFSPGYSGGYGVLLQTCFRVTVPRIKGRATSTDRHVVYVSTNSSRNVGTGNVCRGITITDPDVQWHDGTTIIGASGFDAPFEIRSPIGYTLRGGHVRGGYGGADVDSFNGAGTDILFDGVKFTGQIWNGTNSRACIAVTRSAGAGSAYLTDGLVIKGCTLAPTGASMYGIDLGMCKNVVITGNVGKIVNSQALVQINAEVTILYSGANTWNNNAGYTYIFNSATADNITLGKDTVTLTGGGLMYQFAATPTNLVFGYTRTAVITVTAGTITVTDPFLLFNGTPVTHANGMTVTFAAWVPSPTNLKVVPTPASTNVAQVSVAAPTGQAVPLDVRDYAGAVIPAAGNTYKLTVSVLS